MAILFLVGVSPTKDFHSQIVIFKSFGALLKGLTSVVDTYCQSWDTNPQPWVTSGFKSNTLSIRPRLPLSPKPPSQTFDNNCYWL